MGKLYFLNIIKNVIVQNVLKVFEILFLKNIGVFKHFLKVFYPNLVSR